MKRKTKAFKYEVAVIAGARDLMLVRDAIAYASRCAVASTSSPLSLRKLKRLREIAETVLLRAMLGAHPKLENLR